MTLGGFSAHADRTALLGWLGAFRRPPARTFLVHGEAEIAAEFARTIDARLGWSVQRPSIGDSFELDAAH